MTVIHYEYEAAVRNGASWVPLPVTAITPSVDRDRIPYAAAQVECGPMAAATRALLDPRQTTAVRWRIRQVDSDGTVRSYIPRVGASTGQYATMHVRSLQRTLDGVTLALAGGESLADDKLNLGPKPDGTIAPTTAVLVEWALQKVTGTAVTVTAADAHAAEVLAGKPWQPYIEVGESFAGMLETELNSQDCRLLDLWGLGWVVATRGTPPTYTGAPTVVKVSSHEDVPADVDPIILDLAETISRDGDWADAVVVRGETTTDGYVSSWQHLARQTAHTKGIIVDTGRQEPSGNLAASIAERAAARGRDISLTCYPRFDVLPGMTIETHTLADVTTGTVVAVSWDLASGEMTIRAQSDVTITIDDVTRSESGPQETPATLTRRLQSFQSVATPALEKAVRLTESLTASWQDAQIGAML